MASGKNHQPGVYTGPNAHQLYCPQEYSQELHIQMCKKIAQLTKVIYALNLKIEELEVTILSLKESHQDELDQIFNETRQKVLQYESKVGEEQILRVHMQELEETLEKNKVIKEQILSDLAMYKEQVEQRELKTRSDHGQRITALSKEMMTMKTDYENQVQRLKEEADSLRKKCKAFEKDKSGEKLNEKLHKEIHTLSKEVESLKTQNQKQKEEHAQKTSKLQSSYIKERENLRKTLQQSVTEMLKQWQHKEQEQKKSSQAKEAAMQQEIKQLKADIETKVQDIKEVKKRSQKMKERIQELEVQLKQKCQEVIKLQAMQSQVEVETSPAKERQQEREIHNQTDQTVTKTKTHKTAVTEFVELKTQLTRLQQKSPTKICTSRKNDDVSNSKQEESSNNHLKQLKSELETYKKENSRLEKENTALKGSLELHSKETLLLKQEALDVKQKRINEEELKMKQKAELESIRQNHQKEMQAIMSDFSNAQSFLQAKIVSLETELKEMEDERRKQHKLEDAHLINCLQDKLTAKEQIIKHLLEERNCDNMDTMTMYSEAHRSQSFSCNPNAGSLTPTLKKKIIGEVPTRVISVPNLAAYEKTLPNHDFIARKGMNSMRSSPSLDHSMKPGLPFKPPAQILNICSNRKNNGNITSKAESKDQEPKNPEWFTKYFSF
ncbi:protein FAM184B [Bombina bombina]|uniref:protein FAM184B n=1 Tax=Bombina bombina TaxID=8345 RepID=UPI00235A6EDA|nr:protein FAM184B [Bombina bombina]